MSLKPEIHSIVAALLFVAISGCYLVLALYFPSAYIFATYEDLIGEWMQCFGFAIAAMFSVGIVLQGGRYRWFFMLLAMACFYTVMEEISWGQRLFDFATPEMLLERNLQGEANLHNLLTGPVSTSGKTVIAYLLAMALLGYGLIYPLTARLNWRITQWLDAVGIAAPPCYLWPYFTTAACLEIDRLDFNEAEVAELLVAVALALQAAHYWYRSRLCPDLPAQAPLPRGVSVRLSRAMPVIVMAIVVLSAATTYAVYNSSTWRPAIENRLLNGYEKFAGRYGAYGRWDIAALLYVRVQAKDPDNAYYLAAIADAFRKAGNETLFGIYHTRAFDEAQQDLAEQPDDVRSNLSMARLYVQAGDAAMAAELEKRANELALEDLRRNPGSAYHAYWLAKTYKELGDVRSASEYYRQAFERKPSSTKYRKAYYAMQQYAGQGDAQDGSNNNE